MNTKKKFFLLLPSLLIGLLFSFVKGSYVKGASPSFLFDTTSKNVDKGVTFDVKVLIDTGGQSVGGAGAKISYDPNVVNIISITPGTIFADYPYITFDNSQGKINISGVVSSSTNLFNGQGVFATIKILAKRTGNTEINFDFKPGSTTDSNIAITQAPGDILAEVNKLSVTVKDAPVTVSLTPPLNSSSNQGTSGKTEAKEGVISFIISKITNLFKGEKANNQYDPYAPIQRRDPNVVPAGALAPAKASSSNMKSDLLVYSLLGAVFVLLVTALAVIIFKKKKSKSGASNNPIVYNNI